MASNRRLQPFSKQLQPHSMPAAILQKSRQLKQLADDLVAFIPEPLATNCQLANLQNRTLTFVTSNAHWAMQLRALQTPLLQAATELSSRHIDVLQITVEPNWHSPAQPTTHHELTAQSADVLRSTARHLDDNPTLQDALLKLAQHADKPANK